MAVQEQAQPRRKKEKRVDASKIQGKGAYVLVTPLKVAETKLARLLADAPMEEKEAHSRTLITDHVVGWNWGDEEGNPLPIPAEDDTVLDGMTVEEMDFLAEAIAGDPNARSG